MPTSIERFIQHVQAAVPASTTLSALKARVTQGSSAGSHSLEEAFTREVLCPIMARYFNGPGRPSGVTTEGVKQGLGTEGYQNVPGFGFTPACQAPHLFRKNDLASNAPPREWFRPADEALPRFQACPDFAIRAPLPFNAVGEVKLIAEGSPEAAVTELYNAARQAAFYLSVFRREYEAALLVIVDATVDRAVEAGLKLLHPELRDRFGAGTGIYLALCKLE